MWEPYDSVWGTGKMALPHDEPVQRVVRQKHQQENPRRVAG